MNPMSSNNNISKHNSKNFNLKYKLIVDDKSNKFLFQNVNLSQTCKYIPMYNIVHVLLVKNKI